jgi:hypothetical protein
MKIEIENRENIKVELKKPDETKIDFSSINRLKGNKIILEYIFQTIRQEYNGKES